MQVILKYSTLLSVIFTALLIISMSSCKKDELEDKIELFNHEYKDLQLRTGFVDNGIPINAENWSVEYVKDAVSGEILKDKAGNPMALNTFGSVELLAGWLKLEKKEDNDLLNISLKENLSTNPRKFLIGILADGKRDELSFTQTRGEGYAIANKEIIEVPGSRKEYTSDEGCHAITVTNNSSIAKNMDITDIFKDVKYMSEFRSEDNAAFNWVNSQDTLIFMDEVLRDDVIYWSGQVPYKKGQSFEPYIKTGSKQGLLVQPYTSTKVRGEMVYLERECLYTFTIKNLSSGNKFEISGTWNQKIPLSSITIIYQ